MADYPFGLLTPALRLPPSSVRTHMRTPSRSPERNVYSSLAEFDPLLRNLSPESIIRTLSSISTSHADEISFEDPLSQSVKQASPAERALGIRAALIGQRLRDWHAEILGWQWPNSRNAANGKGFLPPSGLTRKLLSARKESGVDEEAVNNNYVGCLPVDVIEQHETRLEEIKDGLYGLDMEELKEHVLDAHIPSRLMSSDASSSLRSQRYSELSDFTTVITATILGALPLFTKLNTIINAWDVRLAALRQLPAFLDDLEKSKDAVSRALDRLEQGLLPYDGEPNFLKDAFEHARGVLENMVIVLARRMDNILDVLEGSDDCLPSYWIDDMEQIEDEFAIWSFEAEKMAIENEWKRSLPEEEQAMVTRASSSPRAQKTAQPGISMTDEEAEEHASNSRIIQEDFPDASKIGSTPGSTSSFENQGMKSNYPITPDTTPHRRRLIESPAYSEFSPLPSTIAHPEILASPSVKDITNKKDEDATDTPFCAERFMSSDCYPLLTSKLRNNAVVPLDGVPSPQTSEPSTVVHAGSDLSTSNTPGHSTYDTNERLSLPTRSSIPFSGNPQTPSSSLVHARTFQIQPETPTDLLNKSPGMTETPSSTGTVIHVRSDKSPFPELLRSPHQYSHSPSYSVPFTPDPINTVNQYASRVEYPLYSPPDAHSPRTIHNSSLPDSSILSIQPANQEAPVSTEPLSGGRRRHRRTNSQPLGRSIDAESKRRSLGSLLDFNFVPEANLPKLDTVKIYRRRSLASSHPHGPLRRSKTVSGYRFNTDTSRTELKNPDFDTKNYGLSDSFEFLQVDKESSPESASSSPTEDSFSAGDSTPQSPQKPPLEEYKAESAHHDTRISPTTPTKGALSKRRSPQPATPVRSSDDLLEERITSILTTIPAKIRLKSAVEFKKNGDFLIPDTTSSSGLQTRSPTPSRSSTPTPSLTLTRAYNHPKRLNNREDDSAVRLYHLHRGEKAAPLKLFIRSVGEDGERVMVRVGGGWADLAEYLREYAVHHRRRVASDAKFEVRGLPSPNTGDYPPAAQARHMTPDNGRITPSGPVSASSSLFVRKTRRPAEQSLSQLTAANVEKMSDMSGSLSSRRRLSASSSASASLASTIGEGQAQVAHAATPLGLAGPKPRSRQVSSMTPENEAWVEGVVDQARKTSSTIKQQRGWLRPGHRDADDVVTPKNRSISETTASRRVFLRGYDKG